MDGFGKFGIFRLQLMVICWYPIVRFRGGCFVELCMVDTVIGFIAMLL